MPKGRCFSGFIPNTTTIMLANSPTIGHHSKLLHVTIQAYFSILMSGFSIRRTAGKFNKISPDQAIKQSTNKDKKCRGDLEESICNRNHLKGYYIDD